MKIANDFHPLTIFAKSLILDVQQDSKYVSANVDQRSQKLKIRSPFDNARFFSL